MDPTTDPTWKRWDEVDRLFAAALDLPQADRAAFITSACGGDRELHEALTRLLVAEAESTGMFEAPDAATSQAALRELSESLAVPAGVAGGPPRAGPYRLVRELGRGGMGSVYLGERADADFEQQVAVKVLRRGLDTDDVVRRFIAERRILAALNHPNIARLFDGGSTDDGRPFLVMEHVEGTTITAYCDEHALSVRERLELFLAVADAVRYAHTQLVVHRDLKPSNILVTADGRVKLLDFGIAKLLLPGDDGEDGLTRTGAHVLTPDYASPEQRRGEAITTASDVYQLGMLLYVLLTAQRPFAERRHAENHQADYTVTAPSAVVGANPRLRNILRGDLDTIVLKALRQEPERRYASVELLAGDVRAHLDGRPVSARSDTLRYRAGKFLSRHVWIAPAAAAVLLVLALYLVSSARHTAAVERERNAARAEADRASEVQRLLVDLFRSADPFEPADPERGRSITVVEAMDLGAARVLNQLENRPRIQASLLDALAEVYTNLGVPAKAQPLAARALTLQERINGVGSSEYRASLARLALVQHADADSALALFRRRLDLALAAHGPLHAEVAEARVDIASHLKHSLSRPVDAEIEFLHVLAMADSTDVPAAELAEAHRGLADIYGTLGRPADAEPHARRSVVLHRELYGETSPNTAMAYESLAKMLGALGKTEEAESEFERAIGILKDALGPENGNTLSALNNLALLRRRAGDLSGAEQALRQLVAAQARARGAEHREVGSSYQNLGAVLADQGKVDEAAEMHARAAAIYEAALDPGNYLTALPYLSLAGVELTRGDFRAAESHARRALRTLSETLPADHFATAVARCRVGRALAGQGRIAPATLLLREAAEALPADTPVPAYREECLAALAQATDPSEEFTSPQ